MELQATEIYEKKQIRTRKRLNVPVEFKDDPDIDSIVIHYKNS